MYLSDCHPAGEGLKYLAGDFRDRAEDNRLQPLFKVDIGQVTGFI